MLLYYSELTAYTKKKSLFHLARSNSLSHFLINNKRYNSITLIDRVSYIYIFVKLTVLSRRGSLSLYSHYKLVQVFITFNDKSMIACFQILIKFEREKKKQYCLSVYNLKNKFFEIVSNIIPSFLLFFQSG